MKSTVLRAISLSRWRRHGVALALALLASTTPAHAIDLLSAWEFNSADLSGSTIATSGGTLPGIAGSLQGDASLLSGALALDGDGDYLQFGNDLVGLRTLSSFTMSAWVLTNSEVTTMRRIVEHEDNTYFWAENNQFQYTTHGSSTRATSTTAPAAGEWQHLVTIYNEGQPAKLYVNGVLEGTSSGNQGALPNNTQTFQIGARRSGSGTATNFWDGFIDDVAIWNGELAQSNIDELAGLTTGGYLGRSTPTSITPIAPPPPPPPPPSGAKLIAHWSMDNNTIAGDIIVDTAGDTNGPYIGTKANGGPITGVPGKYGQAAEFAGGANNSDSHYIDLSPHATTLGTLTEGTISAWIKPDTAGLTSDVLTIFSSSDANAPSTETRLFVSNGGTQGVGNLVYGTRGSSANGETVSTGVNLLDDAWHHVVVTVDDANNVALYIDGENVGNGTGGFFGDLSLVNSLAIGRNKDNTAGGGQWFYDGLIDDVRIYDKAMTALEVQAIVPEPGTLTMFLIAALATLGLRRRAVA